MNTTQLNLPIIKLLVVKDWQLFEKQLAAYVVAGIVALCFLGMAKPWSFYVGSLLLIVVMVAAACFSISTSLLVERKEQTMAFIMSLPVSPRDFYIAKLVGNLITFAVPFLIMAAGTWAVILLTPIPDGLFVYSLLMFGYIAFAYCLSLGVAMAVESEGLNTFAMIASMVMINPFIMGLSQIPAISDSVALDQVSWSAPAVAILLVELLLGISILCVTGWVHARKKAFH
jgi:ABC-type transport system involved in multi-copper enzyme maturation permease subunit